MPGQAEGPAGERIRQAREALGLSQGKLAGAVFSRGYISLVERGLVTPSRRSLSLLARRLKKPVDYFLTDSRTLDTLETLTQAGEALWLAGRLDEARTALEEARRLAERFGWEPLGLSIHVLLGRIALAREDWALALEALRQALHRAVEQGHRRLAAEMAGCLGLAACGAGEAVQAVKTLRASVDGIRGGPGQASLAAAVDLVADQILGDWCLGRGAPAAARAAYGRALARNPRHVDPAQWALLAARLATALAEEGGRAAARSWVRRALAWADVLEGPARALVRAEAGRAYLGLGENDAALALLERAYRNLTAQGPPDLLAGVAELALAAAARRGGREVVQRWGYRVADAGFRSRGWQRAKVRACMLLARLAYQEGDRGQALNWLEEAGRAASGGGGDTALLAAGALRLQAGKRAAAGRLWQLAGTLKGPDLPVLTAAGPAAARPCLRGLT